MDFAQAVLYILKDVSAVISLLMIMHFIFLSKLETKKYGVIFIFLTIIINGFVGVFLLLNANPESADIMDFISNVIYIVAVRVMTEHTKLTKILWIVMLYIMTVDMLYSILSPFTGDQLYVECIINIIIFSFVSILIYAFAVKSGLNLLPKVFDEIPRWVFVAIMLFDLSCYYKEFGLSAQWYKMFYTISSVMVILCMVYLFFKIFYMSYEQNRITKQIQLQTEFYKERLAQQDDLRSFRHDYKNHMLVVNYYLENGDLQQASDYLKTLNDNIGNSLNNVYTGNFVTDAVLGNKIKTAKEKGIEISFRGCVPEEGIEPQDLCLIFSNLLDNAVEACEKVKGHKFIEIESGIHQNFYILSISNSCETAPVRKNGKFRTWKKDSANHGIGLKNVTSAVEKYKGTLVTDFNDNVFITDIRLALKQYA